MSQLIFTQHPLNTELRISFKTIIWNTIQSALQEFASELNGWVKIQDKGKFTYKRYTSLT